MIYPPRVVGSSSEFPVSLDIFNSYRDRNFTFIDKSLLCSDFIRDTSHTTLILRPRRFGKTTNLSMLESFFRVPRPEENLDERIALFKDLLIYEQVDFWNEHFAKYTVVRISLKDLDDVNWECMLDSISATIVRLFRQHQYLKEHLSPEDQHIFQLLRIGQAGKGLLLTSLEFLVHSLVQYHGKQCIVLIDEYDWPMEHSYSRGFYFEANSFFSHMFSLLAKDNPDIFKILFAGVLRIGQSGFLSGLNNLIIYPLYRQSSQQDSLILYEDKFGFTENEVREVLRRSQRAGDLQSVAEWYNGYFTGSGSYLYNPVSIMRLMQYGKFESYWTRTGSTVTLRQYLWNSTITFKNKVSRLIRSFHHAVDDPESGVKETILDNLTYSDIDDGIERDQALFTLLFYAGYLTTNSYGCLVIPNKEVFNEWQSWILSSILANDRPATLSLLTSLINGNATKFCNEFPNLFIASVSFHDTTRGSSENIYHMFVLGMCIFFRSEGYGVESNIESGRGRSDLLVVPGHPQHDTMLIFEFKSIQSEKANPRPIVLKQMLNESVEKALDQIVTKKYAARAPQYTKTIFDIGMAFWMKECHIGIRKRTLDNSGRWQYEEGVICTEDTQC
ncbi:hypothetical protein K7432_013861 [Basidiobolus ranarum]|uniref:AAA-ATPase-like domain-containing protein n=1 Tax=Basidiobolus ranarum TaxID=34480 RepID=A0ABR2VR55_9FUNG